MLCQWIGPTVLYKVHICTSTTFVKTTILVAVLYITSVCLVAHRVVVWIPMKPYNDFINDFINAYNDFKCRLLWIMPLSRFILDEAFFFINLCQCHLPIQYTIKTVLLLSLTTWCVLFTYMSFKRLFIYTNLPKVTSLNLPHLCMLHTHII